jgi:adenosylcobinamide-GDP ribazoletransferase
VAGSAGAQAFLGLLVLFFAFDLFHFDGLLDTADAFLGFASKEKRFEILKDPRTGSFGVFAGLVFLGALWYCTARAIEAPRVFAAAFLVAPVTGRAAAALIPVLLKPARPGGLGAMIQPYSKRAALAGLATALVLSLLLSWLGAMIGTDAEGVGSSLTGVALVATGAGFAFGIAAALVSLLPAYGRGLGGYTGDALGAAICLGTVGHLACALAVVGVL